MGVKIVIDSSADVRASIKERFEIVALPIIFGEERYLDGVNLTHAEFYEKLKEGSQLPKTSQATPFEFSQLYEKIVAGGDDAVVITIAEKLSGTYQSAVIAAENFPGRVQVVNSDTVTIGAGILAEYALRLADSGLSAKEIAEKLEEQRGRAKVIAMVDTLEYLKRGGRISKTVAFAGELLSVKPVICVEEGEVRILGKARGTKQGNSLLEQEIVKAGGVDFDMPVLLGYSGTDSTALRRYAEDFSRLWKGHEECLDAAEIGSVVGTHAGPGAIGVAFFTREG